MARKTKEDTQKTVVAILDAAEKVFIRHGIASATIAHVAEEAGVSKGAVYGHYKNKIDLCVAVCLRGLSDLEEIGRKIKKSDATPLGKLNEFGIEYMRLFFDSAHFRNTGEILYAKCENSPEFEPVQQIRKIWEKQAFRTTALFIRNAIAAGELPGTVDPHLGNLYIHSVIDGLICACFYTDRIRAKDPMPTVKNVLRIGITGLIESGRRS